MFLEDYRPYPVGRFNGAVDYQDISKVILGCATKAQDVRFLPDQVGTRFGVVNTMQRQEPYAEVTGIDCLTVQGLTNPGEVPILFTSLGGLRQETPSGSGALVPLTPPFPLPANAFMLSSKAENNLWMAFSDGKQGLVPPLVFNGRSRQLGPAAQNPIGALWNKDRIYLTGDLVRSTDGRWWRCRQSATTFGSPTGPAWPQYNGYFTAGNNFVPSLANDATGGSVWESGRRRALHFFPRPI